MLRPSVVRPTLALTLLTFTPRLPGQVLHTNHRWKQCAIVLDSSLTQGAWRQFTREVGVVTYFRPLASAKPLGRGRFEIGLLNTGTRINDASPAWNDTFSHPDSTHWLFEGSSLHIPGLVARAGLTDRVDVGAYFTKAFGSNYGFAGGQLQYNLLDDATSGLAAAGRLSAVRLFGPEDMRASTYGVDLVVSRDVSRFSPYIGVSGYLAHTHETTTKVDLADVNAFGVQGTLGVAARFSIVRLGAEYDLARVSGVALKVAVGR